MIVTIRTLQLCATFAVTLSTLITPAAQACGPQNHRVGGAAGQLAAPLITLPGLHDQGADPAVTGLWKTVFVSGGSVVNVGFDMFHSDGTEFAVFGGVPPSEGNVCPGVWEKTGPRTYTTLHPAFDYGTAGISVVSIFIEHMHITLSADGKSFTGTFTWDSYSFTGTLLPGSLAGTLTGTRIGVNTPFPFPFPF